MQSNLAVQPFARWWHSSIIKRRTSKWRSSIFTSSDCITLLTLQMLFVVSFVQWTDFKQRTWSSTVWPLEQPFSRHRISTSDVSSVPFLLCVAHIAFAVPLCAMTRWNKPVRAQPIVTCLRVVFTSLPFNQSVMCKWTSLPLKENVMCNWTGRYLYSR